jgi:hypothetical protein
MIEKIRTIPMKIILVVTIIAVLALSSSLLFHHYFLFTQSLKNFNGIYRWASRSEVLYRLGIPDRVIESPKYDSSFGDYLSRVYDVNGPLGDINSLPKGMGYKDYNEWVYEKTDGYSRMSIVFDTNQLAKSLIWYNNGDCETAWRPVGRIVCGDSEEDILEDLGDPDSSRIKDVSKTMNYVDIGITFTLTKGKVYMIETHNTDMHWYSSFRRFLNGIF